MKTPRMIGPAIKLKIFHGKTSDPPSQRGAVSRREGKGGEW